MLAEDECQAKSTEGAANTDCGTVGKLSLTDYRPGIIVTTVVRSESKSCPEKTDLQIISRIHRLLGLVGVLVILQQLHDN